MTDKILGLRAGKRTLILPVSYMVCIFILSSIPMGEDVPGRYDFIKQTIHNLLHIPLFGILAFLWMRAFDKNGLRLEKAIIYTLAISVFYAAFDEFHQFFVAGRDASLGDIALDAIGFVTAIYLYRKFNARIRVNK